MLGFSSKRRESMKRWMDRSWEHFTSWSTSGKKICSVYTHTYNDINPSAMLSTGTIHHARELGFIGWLLKAVERTSSCISQSDLCLQETCKLMKISLWMLYCALQSSLTCKAFFSNQTECFSQVATWLETSTIRINIDVPNRLLDPNAAIWRASSVGV